MSDETGITDEVERLPDTDLEWGEGEELQAKKRGCFLPVWLWVCGGGCLLTLILGIFGCVKIIELAKGAIDPEQQWSKLDKVLPYDEQPEHLQIIAGWQLGVEYYILVDPVQGYMVSVYYFDLSDAEEAREAFFDPEMQVGVMGVGEREDEELSMVRIGSRDRQVMRFYQSNVEFSFGNGEDFQNNNSGYSAVVDVTAEGDPGLLAVLFMAMDGQTAIPDEGMIAFFENFLVD